MTDTIISNDEKRKGLTATIQKQVAEYSVGEAITLACYFARNVIDNYRTLEDSISEIFSADVSTNLGGKCTDYAGLAVHYLR
jgi:hypothetical protein